MVNLLKAIRAVAGISQIELADRLKLSQSAISKFESGELVPDWETRQRFATECSKESHWPTLHDLAAKVRQP